MREQEVLRAIENGATAHELLLQADPNFNRRWNALCKSMVTLLKDVRTHFPDAQYYTASGGFNLLLGAPHGEGFGQPSQQELLALEGKHGVAVGDGDW